MIIREERDLRCVSISSTQVSGAVVLSERWLGRFSYPLCYLPSCSSQGLEGRAGEPTLLVPNPSPLFLFESHLSLNLTVQGTHQLRFGGLCPGVLAPVGYF